MIKGKSAASVCRRVAAWVPDMFRDFYLVKNHKIVKNSTTTKAREKIRSDLKSLQFKEFFDVCLTIFKNQILLNKITNRLQMKTKLFTRLNCPILLG
jgi:hypothetical protein